MRKQPSRLSRDGLTGRVPPPPGKIVAANQAMLAALPKDAIDLWKLDAPPLEYHADLCDIRDINGCPTLYFAGADPFNPATILNAVVISFPRRHFDLLWDSLVTLRATINKRIEKRYKDVQPVTFPREATLPQSSQRRYHCEASRIALNDDVMMADFYSIAPYVQQQGELTSELMLSLIRPCIRVYMTPVMFQHLAELGDSFVGRGK